jgi:hypothetical protein
MRKIPTLFVRDPKTKLVTSEVTPGCEWVLAGQGLATRKFDGTCCLVRLGRLYKRHDVHVDFEVTLDDGRVVWPKTMYQTRLADGRLAYHNRPIPAGFEPAQDPVPVGGHWPGWVPIGDGPEDQWHREAMFHAHHSPPDHHTLPDWTYELCGPKVQGNPEGFSHHRLLMHSDELLAADVPRDFLGLQNFLHTARIEGVVWWRDLADPDCDKAKLKVRDFGFKRFPGVP